MKGFAKRLGVFLRLELRNVMDPKKKIHCPKKRL